MSNKSNCDHGFVFGMLFFTAIMLGFGFAVGFLCGRADHVRIHDFQDKIVIYENKFHKMVPVKREFPVVEEEIGQEEEDPQ